MRRILKRDDDGGERRSNCEWEDNVKQLENKAKLWNHPEFKSPIWKYSDSNAQQQKHKYTVTVAVLFYTNRSKITRTSDSVIWALSKSEDIKCSMVARWVFKILFSGKLRKLCISIWNHLNSQSDKKIELPKSLPHSLWLMTWNPKNCNTWPEDNMNILMGRQFAAHWSQECEVL